MSSLKFPDILEHKNSNLPIVSSLNIIGGHHEVANITARNAIPIEKRRIRMLVSYNDSVAEVTKKFVGSAVDDINWSSEGNWQTVDNGGVSGLPLRIENLATTSFASYENLGADDFLTVRTASVISTDSVAEFLDGNDNVVFYIKPSAIYGEILYGFYLEQGAASATNAVYTFVGDTNTGVGRAADDQLSLIAGLIEGLRLEEASNHIIQKVELHAGITANVTQTQGQTPLLSSYNEISVVANANDVVTMPTATIGYKITVMNNGVNTLQIFPASGDNLGVGIDTSITLASGANATYLAYNSINWETIV